MKGHSGPASGGGTGRLRRLFGVLSLHPLAATRSESDRDIELGDDGLDGRDVGLISGVRRDISSRHPAIGTTTGGDVDGTVDLFGRLAMIGAMPWFATGYFTIFRRRIFGSAERSGLTFGGPRLFLVLFFDVFYSLSSLIHGIGVIWRLGSPTRGSVHHSNCRPVGSSTDNATHITSFVESQCERGKRVPKMM